MGFNNHKEFIEAELDGKVRNYIYRKAVIQATTQGFWYDVSMSTGNPVPNYYAASPLEAKVLRQSTDGGIFHGSNVTPYEKYLKRLVMMSNSATPLPMTCMLLDYLMYYPFIDEGTTDPQTLTNTNTLTRYTDGKGVQVMAVSVAARTGGFTFNFTYTNQDGVSGRISQTVIQNAQTYNGNIVTSATAVNQSSSPFIGLQDGDSGVRSIESVQMISGTDVGLFSLVLVKPLVTFGQMEITPVELNFGMSELPKIEDDAYLNFIVCPNGSLNAVTLIGSLMTIFT